MEDIKLGTTEVGAITLPTLRWISGNKPSLPVNVYKQIEEKRMSDGSLRWGFYKKKRQWALGWGYLSKAELFDDIEVLYDHNQILKFQNNNESAVWYDVVFVSLDYEPVDTSILQLERYLCRIVLREA